MKENTVLITEKDGTYQIENNGISEFALLGILESIVFEMKSANRRASPDAEPPKASAPVETTEDAAKPATEEKPEAAKQPEKAAEKVAAKTDAPDLRTRIGNAVKAIKSLGGNVPNFDVETATDEELHEELSVLTEQYKRLKNSQAAKK